MKRETRIDLDEDALLEEASNTKTEVIISEDGNERNEEIIDEDGSILDKLPKRAIENADGTVTLPLLYPRKLQTKKDGKIREREFKELTFYRLTGADQRAIAAASEEIMSVVAFAQSTKLNQAIMNALFDRMDAADIADGGRVLNHFLTSGQRTGR